MDTSALVTEAKKHVGEFSLSKLSFTAASVACALETEAGHVYVGICIDLACGIGFCAEHSAVAAMLLHRETRIVRIAAVDARAVVAPCGRCRELLLQVNALNWECEVALPDGSAKLGDLLPHSRSWHSPT